MVCQDYFAVEEFFEEYKKREVDCIVLIADSQSIDWLQKFRTCCRKYTLSAIICNSVGSGTGNSCILDAAVEHVEVVSGDQRYKAPLPRLAMAAIGAI